MIRYLANPAHSAAARMRADRRRRKAGDRLHIDYFHQVDDPYSHLAAQAIGALRANYDIDIRPRVAGPPDAANVPEPDLLADYARKDASNIASAYCLEFPTNPSKPAEAAIDLAQRVLVSAHAEDFGERAVSVGAALWSGDREALLHLAHIHGIATASRTDRALAEATHERKRLGHYSGAMFHLFGEWYWGIDRLHHLERHLAQFGLAREKTSGFQFPRPPIARAIGVEDVTLEFFLSLRSPYSAIAFDRTVRLANDCGLKLVVRPVLPMVMRGAPVTLRKSRYIFHDTWREAAVEGIPFGNFVDPIGRPIERAFSLFPWARKQGREVAFLSQFLRMAFCEGVNIDSKAGIERVVTRAGLSWSEAQRVIDSDGWRDELESNRQAMHRFGIWGVPSYRVHGPSGREDFVAWGQDRLWRVAQEVAKRARSRVPQQRALASPKSVPQ